MSLALRRSVPLKAMCSRRWEMPCSASRSWRAPAATQTPSETVSTCGMWCETTRRPLASTRDLRGHAAAPCLLRARRLDEALDGGEIVGQHGDAFLRRHQRREPRRQGRALAGDRFDGVGELRRMRGGERDVRDVLGLRRERLARGDDGARAVGVEQIAALRLHAPDAVGDGVLDRRVRR